jgi:hypothetical protein
MGDVESEVPYGRRKGCMRSLHFPLSFVVDLNLLIKEKNS